MVVFELKFVVVWHSAFSFQNSPPQLTTILLALLSRVSSSWLKSKKFHLSYSSYNSVKWLNQSKTPASLDRNANK